MKTRLLLILVLLSSSLIVLAQKKSARIISPFEIIFTAQDSNQDVKKEEVITNVDNMSKNEVHNEQPMFLAKQSKNKYYMAYLFKTHTFDETKITEFNEYFIYDEIKAYTERNKKGDLLIKSEGHDSFFEKFAK
ncbi:MAG: hypothetical protein J6T80_01255 [Paludibacteraceae bacterium]|nr:hypothetical protein [Paludibacteraceae bacterium]